MSNLLENLKDFLPHLIPQPEGTRHGKPLPLDREESLQSIEKNVFHDGYDVSREALFRLSANIGAQTIGDPTAVA